MRSSHLRSEDRKGPHGEGERLAMGLEVRFGGEITLHDIT